MYFWEFPDIECTPRGKVTVLNRKYCWLYPKREYKKLKKIVPCFDDCKTLYTKCDYKLEACTQEQLLILEDKFRKHETLMKTEIEIQTALCERLWALSQRYLYLNYGGVCVKLYPEIVSAPAEYAIVHEFRKALKQINKSNCRLSVSIESIRKSLSKFAYRCKQLDTTVESPFIKGNWYIKSLAYNQEIIEDLFQYFFGVLCKLKCWAQLMEPTDLKAIDDYLTLLKTSANCDYIKSIENRSCTCLKTKKTDCINIS